MSRRRTAPATRTQHHARRQLHRKSANECLPCGNRDRPWAPHGDSHWLVPGRATCESRGLTGVFDGRGALVIAARDSGSDWFRGKLAQNKVRLVCACRGADAEVVLFSALCNGFQRSVACQNNLVFPARVKVE